MKNILLALNLKQCARKKTKKGEVDFLYNKHFLQFTAKSGEGRGYGH